MELQYKQQTLHNNLKSASYASGGLQSHTWEFQWGLQGLEQAIKRIGMSQVITQNFSTDPMGRILSMTYQGPTYGGELCFHYDVQGNTSLLTDSNGSPVASFRYDLHNGRIAASWNPNNLEIVNLKGGRQRSIRITTAVTGFDRDIYIPSWPPVEINPLPVNGNGNGNDWGGIGAAIGIGAYTDTRVTDTEKDCGVMDMQGGPKSDPCTVFGNESCEEMAEKYQNWQDNPEICPDGFGLGPDKEAICKKSFECFQAADKMLTHHSGCLEGYWWIFPSCWDLRSDNKYKDYINIGKEAAGNRRNAFRHINNQANNPTGGTAGVPNKCRRYTVPYN